MVKWLKKILFVAICLSFFISATEMDLGGVHNTFFDEYDTYVKAEQVSLDHAEAQQQQHDAYTFICYFLNQYNASNGQASFAKHPAEDYYNCYPPRLYLRNSVWRI